MKSNALHLTLLSLITVAHNPAHAAARLEDLKRSPATTKANKGPKETLATMKDFFKSSGWIERNPKEKKERKEEYFSSSDDEGGSDHFYGSDDPRYREIKNSIGAGKTWQHTLPEKIECHPNTLRAPEEFQRHAILGLLRNKRFKEFFALREYIKTTHPDYAQPLYNEEAIANMYRGYIQAERDLYYPNQKDPSDLHESDTNSKHAPQGYSTVSELRYYSHDLEQMLAREDQEREERDRANPFMYVKPNFAEIHRLALHYADKPKIFYTLREYARLLDPEKSLELLYSQEEVLHALTFVRRSRSSNPKQKTIAAIPSGRMHGSRHALQAHRPAGRSESASKSKHGNTVGARLLKQKHITSSSPSA